MSSGETLPPRSLCPNRDELIAFTRGQLTEDKLDAIADHLAGCPSCESSLLELDKPDTVLAYLRVPPLLPLSDDPLCDQLESRARRLAKEPAGAVTVSASESATMHDGPPLPSVFGAYLLLEQLGQGGMGVVYKARQESLKRMVALKLVRAGVYAGNEERTRFQREGEAIARIHHPHVVLIYEFGEHQGQLFFSMELLEGGTLANKLNGCPLPERQAAELVRTLAQAVQAAHEQGIVHRDLKPGNVLFAADGTVKISDFGLAKVLDSERSDTITDTILGTPAYMAPEQARGESRRIGPAADVYALGVILYEALTGQPPFRGESRHQTLELVRTCEPQPPSRRRPGLSRDLEAICLKCLEKEASQRYPSAAALADDLDHWLKDEPLAFRPPRGWRRVGRILRRRRRIIVAALLLGLMLSVAAILWYRDPERTIESIEARLACGQEQTLIADTGRPAWFRLVAGERASQAAVEPDGFFTVHSWSLALVEVLRDPNLESYRVRAEVRHENSAADVSEVGIYIAYRGYPVGQEVVHSFVRMTFNDIDIPKVLHAEPAERFRNQRFPEGNPLRLAPMLYVDRDKPPDWNQGAGGLTKLSVPAGPGRTNWRLLALEVTPAGITAFWESKKLGYLSAETLIHNIQRSLDGVRRRDPQDPYVDGIPADFPWRGGIGLFVHRGSGSFRHVVIEPLPHPQ
jgi:eukaryotic-like serine/threonine-protein kinase